MHAVVDLTLKDLKAKVFSWKNAIQLFRGTETTTFQTLNMHLCNILETVYVRRSTSMLGFIQRQLCTYLIIFVQIVIQLYLQIITGERAICVWPPVPKPILYGRRYLLRSCFLSTKDTWWDILERKMSIWAPKQGYWKYGEPDIY